MRIISKVCLGLDLHKKHISACLRVQRRMTDEPQFTEVKFGTMPDELLALRQFVIEHQVTLVAMESTSVYWMHVYELLEDVTQAIVANAAHVKNVPGRKTDQADAQWLAELGAHGLLRPSVIPPKPIRELRATARYRTKLVATQTAIRNRTIKLLEMAGIKLSSVVSDSFGVTGRAILDALTRDEPVDVIACTTPKLRPKLSQLRQCLGQNLLSPQQRQLLKMHLEDYDAVDAQIARLEIELSKRGQAYAVLIERLDQIPGINELGAITLIAETGVDMSVYHSADHLSVLAGVAPGNAISADKRRRISVRKGNRYLKRILVQIAWAASRKKDSFLRTRFLRLQLRIGRNKAIVALARQILVIIYHVLSGQSYQDLGPDFHDRRSKERTRDALVRRLDRLGFVVEVKPKLP
jgi:transposase